MNLLMVMIVFLHLCWRHIPFIERLLKCITKIPIGKKKKKNHLYAGLLLEPCLFWQERVQWPYCDNVTWRAHNVSVKEIKTAVRARCVL